jgi:hypothetical protein
MLFLIYLQGVDLKIKGSHSHNQKSIDSNIGLVYNRKQSVSAALRVKNKPPVSRSILALLYWEPKDAI